MDFILPRSANYSGVRRPLLLVILDGMGIYAGEREGYPGNAIDLAATPVMDHLFKHERIYTQLKAHGTAVGLPSDGDQGNSEVGHNAFGAGRVFDQGASLVNQAIAGRSIYRPGTVLQRYLQWAVEKKRAVHFIGLLSDGNVHSHIDHLFALLGLCDEAGVERAYIHTLLDGRDVPPVSALRYVGQLEDFLWTLRANAHKHGRVRVYELASGGGRMVTTMDRYKADWQIVKRGYEAHVMGRGPLFPDTFTAIKTLREQSLKDDQYLPHWAIHQPGSPQRPLATIEDDDVVVFFNFRGDRAIEISMAFTDENFVGFPREVWPRVKYAGMMQYDGDLKIPPAYLVSPPGIDRTISEYLAHNGVRQFAISETQKFGHITYFWNGNNSEPFNRTTETWAEIPSDKVAFDEKPEMKAAAIAARVLEELPKNYDFLRLNFANGDMVGHTGNLQAAVTAVETVDKALGQLVTAIDALKGTLIVTADHGNCEMMIETDASGKAKKESGGGYKPMVSHTTNPVPFVIHGPDTGRYQLNEAIVAPGLANVAATILTLLGFEPPADYCPSLITVA